MTPYVDYLAVVVVLGVLIFVHELGHFLAAKSVGIGVPRFSIGLGPITPLRFRRGETEYVLSWIPFGGYVKMATREELDELESLEGGKMETPFPPEKLLESKPLLARIFVISAGVVMNAVFAWLAYGWLAYAYGRVEDPTTKIDRVKAASLPEPARALADIPFGTEVERVNGEGVHSWDDIVAAITDPQSEELRLELGGGLEPVVVDVPGLDMEARMRVAEALVPLWEPRVGALAAGSAAEQAGLREGDLIRAVDGKELRSWEDLVLIVEASVGKELTLTVDRGGEVLEIPVTPREENVQDPATGEVVKAGRIGIGPQLDWLRVRYGPLEAVVEGGRQTGRITAVVLYTLKGMLTGQISVRELGGPVLIAQASAQAARRGLEVLLAFMAFLSVNLAILNLLPIPVLDGGHLVFLVLEGLRGGRPVPRALRQRLTMLGFYFLLAFMLLVVINDLLR